VRYGKNARRKARDGIPRRHANLLRESETQNPSATAKARDARRAMAPRAGTLTPYAKVKPRIWALLQKRATPGARWHTAPAR